MSSSEPSRRSVAPRGRTGRWAAGYSVRVHQRLLDKHAERWDRMHAYRMEHGDDETYKELRAQMIKANRAVTRYFSQFYRGGRWTTR